MSDSQSSQEHQVRVEQKMEAKLRDLLEKAKTIIPSYDDETLLRIYKDCYNTDNVFLNKLQMIAKSQKQAEQNQDTDWIQFKQHHRSSAQKQDAQEVKEKRVKYNFLEDKQLIQRAKNLDIQKEKQKIRKRKQQYKQKQQNRQRGNNQPRTKFQEKVQKQDKAPLTQNEKKLKYKQKVQEKPAQSVIIQSTPSAPQQNVNKSTVKYAQKPQKKSDKKPQKVQQTKPLAPSNIDQAPPKNNQLQKKPEIVQPIKKETKIQYKVKEEPKAPAQKTETPAAVKVQAKQQIKQNNPKISQATVEAPTKKESVPKILDEKVRVQFEESCRQNTFILNFILPNEKVQKVSYIRDPKGGKTQIQTRQLLPRN